MYRQLRALEHGMAPTAGEGIGTKNPCANPKSVTRAVNSAALGSRSEL